MGETDASLPWVTVLAALRAVLGVAEAAYGRPDHWPGTLVTPAQAARLTPEHRAALAQFVALGAGAETKRPMRRSEKGRA